MKRTIDEQKEYLSQKLIVEQLRKYDNNQEDIKQFVQANNGEKLHTYLINNAWDDDCNGDTKVFLVRDIDSRQIVFYYALNCGLLYKDYNSLNLLPHEQTVFNNYVTAMQDVKKKGLSSQERERANQKYSDAMDSIYNDIDDPNRATKIIEFAEERVAELEKKDEVFERTKDREHTKHVKETFPAIDIKFICRNKKYKVPIELDFKLGVYVFWEMIVPHIIKISNLIGCKYVYLFAADNTIEDVSISIPDYSDPYYDPYGEDKFDKEDKSKVLKLVDYYMKNLKFRRVSKYIVLKPSYERECHTLVQEVSKLLENRQTMWASHANDRFEDN